MFLDCLPCRKATALIGSIVKCFPLELKLTFGYDCRLGYECHSQNCPRPAAGEAAAAGVARKVSGNGFRVVGFHRAHHAVNVEGGGTIVIRSGCQR